MSNDEHQENELSTSMSADDWYCLMDNDSPFADLSLLKANFALAPAEVIGTPEYNAHKKIIEYREIHDEVDHHAG